MVTGQTPWRQIGDLTLAQFTALIPTDSPMLPQAEAIYNAVRGDTALYAAQAAHESEWGKTGEGAITADHNVLGNKDHINGGYMTFPTWPKGAAWWQKHIRDPSGPYAKTVSIADFVSIYAPASDGNDEARYVQVICEIANKATGGSVVSDKLTYQKVPFPGYIDRQAQTAGKPEGSGWDNLGKRQPMFIVLHRMLGTLSGTDSYFPTAAALTDYGIGTANVDGQKLDGVIYQWNDPYGYRAGWASGPVSAPYGDGLKWLNWSGNKWGYSICNVCGVSIENSGNYTDPMTDFAFGELAKFVAYWFDQWEIAWDKAPIHPETGISAITYHQEWTIGTGKVCPGDWLMSNTQRLIDAAAAIMKPYQTGQTVLEPPKPAPKPDPKPAPKPKYAKPVYIGGLAQLGKADNDKAQAVVSRDGAKFVYVGDRVRAVRDTHRLQYADKNAHWTGPTIKKGEEFDVMWRFTAKDGEDYYYTPYATRILAEDCERISDTPDYASNA